MIALSVFESEFIIVSGQSRFVKEYWASAKKEKRILLPEQCYLIMSIFFFFDPVSHSFSYLNWVLVQYEYLQPPFCLYIWVVLKVTPHQYPWDEISRVQSNDSINGHRNPFSDVNCCGRLGITIIGNAITFIVQSLRSFK